MTVAQTSIFSYRSIKKLGDKQQQVLEAIETLGVASNEQIAEYLGWPINRVTGRVSELRTYGRVGFERLGMGSAGMPVKMWSSRDINDKKLAELAVDCEV